MSLFKHESFIHLKRIGNSNTTSYLLEINLKKVKSSSVISNFIELFSLKHNLVVTNFSAIQEKVEFSNITEPEIFYKNEKFKWSPMTTLSRNKLDKKTFAEIENYWREEIYQLPSNTEIWVTPFNFDWDGFAIIAKNDYKAEIINFFKHTANENDAEFRIQVNHIS